MKANLFITFVAAYLLTGYAGPISESYCEELKDKPPSFSLDNRNSFIKMAEEKFGKLTEADKILFVAVTDGNLADYSEGGDKDKPENANIWGEGRTIKANRIEWMCRDKQAKELVTDKGILVRGAKIVGVVDLSFAEVPFPLAFAGCDFNEMINIQHSKIKILNMMGSHTGSIKADGVKVDGSVYLKDNFNANGEVGFPRATIGGDFDCHNGDFNNKDGNAIFADGMIVKSNVSLSDGFKANGMIHFHGVVIGGDFVCANGKFVNANKGGIAINADGMDVKGGAMFWGNGFKAEGLVSLEGASFGDLFWSNVNLPKKTILDLVNAKTGLLRDDEKSWPADGNLCLDGFVYENIAYGSPKDAKSRIDWIQTQYDPNKKNPQFRPQPYEQLATVLQKSGYENDAKQVLIAKNEDRIRWGPKLSTSEFVWYRIFGPIIGYGYDPLNAWKYIGIIIIIGFGVFWGGHKVGVIVPMEKEAYVSGQRGQLRKGYPKFSFLGFSFLGALVYSIDMFVPVIDLHMMKKYWIPDANKRWGDAIRLYMWIHIIAGWILTTLLIVGLTGLIK